MRPQGVAGGLRQDPHLRRRVVGEGGMFLPHFSIKSKATTEEGPPSLKRETEAESRFDRWRNYCLLGNR
jgi:hypothetical protein